HSRVSICSFAYRCRFVLHFPPCPTPRSSDLSEIMRINCLAWSNATTVRQNKKEASSSDSGKQVFRDGSNHLAHEKCIAPIAPPRSEEHTSELQSRENLVCRLLLEKQKLHQTT